MWVVESIIYEKKFSGNAGGQSRGKINMGMHGSCGRRLYKESGRAFFIKALWLQHRWRLVKGRPAEYGQAAFVG